MSRGRLGRTADLPLALAAGACALVGLLAAAVGVLRTTRPMVIFNYAEGMTLGSLAAFLEGGVSTLYPPAWTDAPLVLTLYTPGYFLTSGAVAGTVGGPLLLAPRLVSLAAFIAVAVTIVAIARRSPAPPWLVAVVSGAVLAHPGVYRQLGAAQPDMLALAWTVLGVWLALGLTGRSRRIPALVCFAAAALTKQNYVVAPLAWLLHRYATGERRAALVDAAVLAVAGVSGLAWLQSATDGGFIRHTLGALTDGVSLDSAARLLTESEPLVWIPLVGVVLLVTVGRNPGNAVRPLPGRFPLAWCVGSAVLNGAASVKLGASVNYFLEPLTALVVLLLVAPGRAADLGRAAGVRWRFGGVALALSIAALTLGVVRSGFDIASEIGAARTAVDLRLAGSPAGHPLVPVDFFPGVLAAGARPYLNDPFAFGALAASGTWDPAAVGADLSDRRVPLVVSRFDLRAEPPPAAAFDDLLFGYFWLLPDVRRPLLANYAATAGPGFWVWRPSG